MKDFQLHNSIQCSLVCARSHAVNTRCNNPFSRSHRFSVIARVVLHGFGGGGELLLPQQFWNE